MRKIIFTIIIVFLTVNFFSLQKVQAQGTLYVSNLGQTPTGSAVIGSDSWIAQEVITGTDSGGYALNSIELLMNPASGSPSGFAVSIYSSSNSEPYQDLGDLIGSDPSAGGLFVYTAPGTALASSTAYFIVVTAATPIALGAFVWSKGQQYANGSNQWEIYPDYESSANGLSWTGYGRSNTFQLGIYATPVPEPSTYALAGLGLACLSFWRRKR